MSVDATTLRSMIRDAARNAFDELRRSRPREAFYAFALYTDDGLMGVTPAANSEEGFAKAAKQYARDERAHARWSTAEWAYETSGDEHFQAVYDLLNSESRDATDGEEAYRAMADKLIGSMVGALQDLDAEGFFGRGADREKVTLFVSVSDSDAAPAVEDESARQLNPASVSAAFTSRFD